MQSLLGAFLKLEEYRQRPESEWCKYAPWKKQEMLLSLSDVKEIFFGGAAGGGKSDGLLRAGLQYAHVPGYSALILRTSTTDLRLPGGLIPKSHEWIGDKAHWHGIDSKWTFPSGATLQFGYLSSALDKYRYRSSEFQFIGFDELTDFTEEDYTFMFSRLRQRRDIGVPERIRSASNPGGPGHEWVKARFIPPQAERDLVNNTLQDVYWLDSHIEGELPSAFVPSKIRDNPAIDPDKYVRNLMHLSPVMRERMMNGDWTIMPMGLIKPEWLRYFTMRDRMMDLLISRRDKDNNIIHTKEVLYSFHEQEARRFVTIDTAGGVEDIEKEHKGKPLSWTACGVWDFKKFGATQALILRHVWRVKGLGYTEIKHGVVELVKAWRPNRILVENKALGPALADDLKSKMPISQVASGIVDKVTRAAPLLNMLEQGQVYLPQGENSWRQPLESEWLSWLGRKEETNDQIDMSSYAAIEAGGFAGGVYKVDLDPRKPATDLVRDPAIGPLGTKLQGGGLMTGWDIGTRHGDRR